MNIQCTCDMKYTHELEQRFLLIAMIICISTIFIIIGIYAKVTLTPTHNPYNWENFIDVNDILVGPHGMRVEAYADTVAVSRAREKIYIKDLCNQ